MQACACTLDQAFAFPCIFLPHSQHILDTLPNADRGMAGSKTAHYSRTTHHQGLSADVQPQRAQHQVSHLQHT